MEKKNLDWVKLLKEHLATPQNYKVNYKITKSELNDFVDGLHEIQAYALEELVARKEKQGFPEATEVINYIRGL